MKLKLLFGLALVSFLPVIAQTGLTCVASSAYTPIVRDSGLTERVGDVIIMCNGAEAPVGTTPTFDIQVFLNVPVTSRILNPTYQLTEALLLVDEPEGGSPPANKQIACDSFGNTTVPGSPCNVHAGVLLGTNSIKWTGIPLYPAAGRSLRVLRLANLRGSIRNMVSGTLMPTAISTMITFVGSGAPQLANSSLTVGYVYAPLQISIRNAANSAELPDGAHYDRCCSVNPELLTNPSGATLTEGTSFLVRVGETFGTATTLRSDGETWPTADAPVFAATPQNAIGWTYSTESGFYNPAFPASPDGLDRAGLATQGTRFYLRFYNVPSGVVLYSGLYALGSTAADSPVRRIVNEIGPFVAAPAAVTAAGPYAPLTMVEPNVYEGTYEVTGFGANPAMISNYDVPVLVGYNSSSVTPGAVQLQAGLAPRIDSDDPANQTVPRFAVPVRPWTGHALDISGGSVASVSIIAKQGASSMIAPFTVQGATGCQPGTYQTPRTFDWAVGLSCTVAFPDGALPGYQEGLRYRRNGWSGGPTGSGQTIVATAGNHTYSMTYVSEVVAKAAVNPASCGTSTFQGGSTQQWVTLGGQVTTTAVVTAGSSCTFQGFSSTYELGLYYSNPYTTNIYIPTTITANFSQGVPRMMLSTYSKSGLAGARLFNIVLRNSGTASAAQPNITNATIVQSSGVPCSPAARVVSPLPVTGPATLAPGETAGYPVQLDFSGCTALPIATPFRLTLTVAAANAAPQTIAITTAR